MRALASALLCVAFGCGGVRTTDVTSLGLEHREYGYRIRAEAANTFVSADWRVESHEMDGNAVGDQKTTPDYVYRVMLDLDGEGTDDELDQTCIYDLRLEHRRNNGRIWVRTFPLPDEIADKDLRVMVEAYVENIAAAGYYTAGIRDHGTVTVEERRYATKVLDTQRIGVAQHDAAVVMFDVANVNQLEMAADARTARAMVAMVRTPYVYELRTAKGRRAWPVLMLIGYANAPADFDAGLPDFRRFVQAVDLRQPTQD